MDKADLGTKRVCPSCGARFYDLSKRPIVCPKCAYSFEPDAMFRQRRRQAEAEEKPEVAEAEAPEPEEEQTVPEAVEEETETPESEEGRTASHAKPVHPAVGMQVVEGEDVEIEDIADADVEETEGDDDTLLEPEDEEDSSDVSGIIDADIEKDER